MSKLHLIRMDRAIAGLPGEPTGSIKIFVEFQQLASISIFDHIHAFPRNIQIVINLIFHIFIRIKPF